jgi:uncharacterized membrane protein (DUF373 family)
LVAKPEARANRIGRSMRYTIEILESFLGIILAIMIILAAVKLLFKVISTEIYETPNKQEILDTLDLVLLLILSIDILRTLFTAVARHAMPIRIVIEAAILAILREIIAVEVRHLDYKMVIAPSISFTLLIAAWIALGILQKRGELETHTSL